MLSRNVEKTLRDVGDLLTPDHANPDIPKRLHFAYSRLRKIVRFPAAGVLRFDANFSLDLVCDFELDSDGRRQYFDYYWTEDPFVKLSPCFRSPDRAIQYADFVDFPEVGRTEFGAFMRSIPYFHPMAVVPLARGVPFGTVTFHRGYKDGEFDALGRFVLEWFAAQVVRCFEISELQNEAELDPWGAALIVLDGDGRIVCASDAAVRLLTSLPASARLTVPRHSEPLRYWFGDEHSVALKSFRLTSQSILGAGPISEVSFTPYANGMIGRRLVSSRNGPVVLKLQRLAGMREVDARLSIAGCTRREIEVVRQLMGGATNETIAQRLGIRPQTMREHVSNIFDKFRVKTRAALTAHLLENTLELHRKPAAGTPGAAHRAGPRGKS